MEHIRFAEPDSERKQAIQEVTRIFIEEKDSLQSENYTKKANSSSISGSKKENVVQKTEHKSIFSHIIGLLLLLISIYTFFNHIKTKRFPAD